MNVFQQLVNKRVKAVTVCDLLKYSKNYQVPISQEQAKMIVAIIKSKQNLNIFDESQRRQLLREIAKQTSLDIARQLNKIFITFMK